MRVPGPRSGASGVAGASVPDLGAPVAGTRAGCLTPGPKPPRARMSASGFEAKKGYSSARGGAPPRAARGDWRAAPGSARSSGEPRAPNSRDSYRATSSTHAAERREGGTSAASAPSAPASCSAPARWAGREG